MRVSSSLGEGHSEAFLRACSFFGGNFRFKDWDKNDTVDSSESVSILLGSLRCGRFRGDGDVTAQVDWARGCRSRAKINLLKILMTASETSSSTSAVLSEIQSLLFVTWPHLKIFDNFSFFTTTLI